MSDFLQLLEDRVFIFDGAMGTSLHRRDLSLNDYDGKENCVDWLVVTRPDVVLDIHREFLAVGCDAIETNTFGGTRTTLGEFGLQDEAIKVNKRAAELAREAADEFSTPDHPRFVIGSMGPGTRSITLGNISFDEVHDAYQEQALALLQGGVDVLLVETCFDILQAKAAVRACLDAMEKHSLRVPLMAQVTMEYPQGTMLLGTEIGAALTTLDTFPLDVIGLNCATGPKEMVDHIRHLSQHSTRRISCLPNAGIPENVDGQAAFPLSPEGLRDALVQFVKEFGVNIVGGCCGTTPDHLREVVTALRGVKPTARKPVSEPSVSSLYGATPLKQEPAPLIVGERTNTTGSRKFKRLLEADDLDGMVTLAREQQDEGAHLLDVCLAYPGRDEVHDMCAYIKRLNQSITIPLVIDSTEWQVMEAALKLIGGKAFVNSINLEEGRTRLDKVVPLAKRYGAALVALSIDEEGQATTADWKFRVAKRIFDICTQEYGVPPTDLMFDPLTLPVTTGQQELYNAAVETLESIRKIKAELPGAGTWLGLSNISFGLSPYPRQVINSVFLRLALDAGLDAAILNASKILPLNEIDEEGRELARRLLLNEREHGDPLQQFISHYEKVQGTSKNSGRKSASLGDTVEERLKQAIIQGRRESLIADLDTALKTTSPLDIINNILLGGMKVVGELFGAGEMQLPFVLQSAEVMKSAVNYLEPFMEKSEASEKGKIVLATVKGDVHDIGKNLVDIILTNNGYKVYNLGIKQPIDNILKAALEHKVDAIGLSGLLVKSTVVMKDDLETLNGRGITMPVICGGAALTRRYVEEDLRKRYAGNVFYGEDAFAGLRIMDDLCRPTKRNGKQPAKALEPQRASKEERSAAERTAKQPRDVVAAARRVLPEADIPTPPFFGSRVVTEINIEDVYPFLNERTLISTQWQFRKNNVRPEEYERQMREAAYPTLERLKQQCIEENILRPAVAYGYFPCARQGDDLVIYKDGTESGNGDGRAERLRFRFPRQPDREQLCLTDYFRDVNASDMDVVALVVVTVGHEVSRRTKELFEANQYTDYLYLHGLGVESAEALAEYWHKHIREEWGIAGDDAADVQKLFKLHYRGCRYSFGYPACPNLEDQALLFQLLNPERIGVTLTEQFQLEPEQSTSALVVHHPAAKYFNIGAADLVC